MTPSTTPSLASHAATAAALAAVYAFLNGVLSPPEQLDAIPPTQSAGSTSATTIGGHIPPMMKRFQLKAGAPAKIPSNSSGWNCAISKPCRPPVEHPFQ